MRILDLRLEAGFGALLEDWQPDVVDITSQTVEKPRLLTSLWDWPQQ